MGKSSFNKGCGCTLIAVSVIAILFALLFALGMWSADDKAGEKNEAEWEEYNEWVAQIDSLEDRALADSLMETRQAPIIRQGGFATGFGIIIAIVVIFIASIPLIIGIVLLDKHRRQQDEEKFLNNQQP